jgi:hypothetical protein
MSHSQSNLIAVIINIYGLALDEQQVEAILATWSQKYDSAWILKAIVESLYRGRYKLVSVDNILKDWQRIGKPRYNFTPEYEREILQKIPKADESDELTGCGTGLLAGGDASGAVGSISSTNSASVGTESYYVFMPVDREVALTSQNLNPEESAPFHYHHDSVAVAQDPTPQSAPSSDAVARVSTDLHYTSRSMPSSLGILPGKSQTDDRRHQREPERQTARPAKRRLFHTLKAIVDPRNHYADAEESMALLPQSLEHNVMSHIS